MLLKFKKYNLNRSNIHIRIFGYLVQLEDKEMKPADTTKIHQAMATLAAQQRASQEAQRLKDRELAAVKVAQEDIDLIAAEFELDRKRAERELREAKGDVKAAIGALLRA